MFIYFCILYPILLSNLNNRRTLCLVTYLTIYPIRDLEKREDWPIRYLLLSYGRACETINERVLVQPIDGSTRVFVLSIFFFLFWADLKPLFLYFSISVCDILLFVCLSVCLFVRLSFSFTIFFLLFELCFVYLVWRKMKEI